MKLSCGLHMGKAYLLSTLFARLVQVLLSHSLAMEITRYIFVSVVAKACDDVA